MKEFVIIKENSGKLVPSSENHYYSWILPLWIKWLLLYSCINPRLPTNILEEGLTSYQVSQCFWVLPSISLPMSEFLLQVFRGLSYYLHYVYFDVQVQRYVRSIIFITFFIRALIFLLDLNRKPSIFLPVLQFVQTEIILLKTLCNHLFT